MGLLLGFAPLIVFTVLMGLSVDLALWAAFAVAFAISIRDFARTQILRTLDIASTLLFGFLALYTGFIQPSLSDQAVRLIVDSGFLIVACGSVLMGNPFTRDYLRGPATAKTAQQSKAITDSYRPLTHVWLLTFAVMSAVDAEATFNRKFPAMLSGAVVLAALTLAVVFTARSLEEQRLQKARADHVLRRRLP